MTGSSSPGVGFGDETDQSRWPQRQAGARWARGISAADNHHERGCLKGGTATDQFLRTRIRLVWICGSNTSGRIGSDPRS